MEIARIEKRRQKAQGREGGRGEIPVPDVLQQYGRWIGAGIVLIVLLVGGYLIYQGQQRSSNEKALTALSRILPYFERGDYQTALDGDKQRQIRGEHVIGLKAIADEYAGTAAGKIAALFAGHALVRLEKIDEAKQYFDLAQTSDALDIAVGGMSGEAFVADAKFLYEGAAEQWEEIAEAMKERGEYQRALLYAAQLAEVAGEREKAARLYREIVLTAPFSYYAGFAKSGLVRIGEDIIPGVENVRK